MREYVLPRMLLDIVAVFVTDRVPYVRILVHSIATRSPANDCKLNFNKEARWLYAELIKSYISFHATSQLLKEPFYVKEPFVH